MSTTPAGPPVAPIRRRVTAQSQVAAAFIAASAALSAAPALAVDGEILISQAKVDAGGITAGDAPGFPATLSRPGRYKLTGNLAVPAGQNGIEVTQNDVTIDFNGFTVTGDAPVGHARIGVLATQLGVTLRGVRVMNGTVTGFEGGYGLYIPADFAVVENMRIVRGGLGIWCGSRSRISNSTIIASRADSGGQGHGIRCGYGSLIEQNIVANNAGSGIIMYGREGMVLGNVIASNGRYGLDSTSGYGNNILVRNNSLGDANYGPQVSEPPFSPVPLHANVCSPECP